MKMEIRSMQGEDENSMRSLDILLNIRDMLNKEEVAVMMWTRLVDLR
jgi:hypothetical protein